MIITPWDRRRTTFGATLFSLLLLLTSCVSNVPERGASAENDLAYQAAEAREASGQNFGFSIRHKALRREGLMGLSSVRIAEILGQPRLRRRDWPADLWQYEAEGCVMDIVFYDDSPEEGVVHAESRLAEGTGLAGGPALDDDCLGRIQAQARI
ncbi:MAG TPA: hypothetical protein DCW68_00120 [Rhodospirillaceae bacterium]|nr:MAG: hypothetical protein A2018_01430 [Alphaproteobacteria bacterium GWF2_58_20]HAU28505.1 hypothetical protein [Rhodospirillaceae bacterium]